GAAESADQDDGLFHAGHDDGAVPEFRVGTEPLLRGAESLQHSAAVHDREAPPAGGRGTLSDPIVALATPPGRSALALIRVSGAGAFALAARCLHPFHADSPRTVWRARLAHPETGDPIDDVLAACFPAPRSYTGEDVIEISTHGGLVVPAAAVAAFVAAGVRLAEPGEFTRRAVLNGRMDLLQAEATADLIDAGSPAQRRRALHQLERGLSGRLSALRQEVLDLEGLIAYDIDFPEEDEGPVSEQRVRRAWSVVRGR